jgi:hypothetical protein
LHHEPASRPARTSGLSYLTLLASLSFIRISHFLIRFAPDIFISRQKAPLDTELARLTECRKLLVKLCDKLSDKSYELHFELGDISRKMDDLQNEHSPKLAEAMRRLDEKASEEWHLAFRALERAHGSPADKCHRRHHKPHEPRNCTMDQWQ